MQPAEPYINNYYEYRNILIAQFTKLFLQAILAHFCGSKNKIRNDWYHQILVVGYQPASPIHYPVKSTSDRISFTTASIFFTITFPLKVQQSLIFLDFFSCLDFLANAARRRVRSSLTYTVGPSPLSLKRRLARMTTSRTWVVANLTITGRCRMSASAPHMRRPGWLLVTTSALTMGGVTPVVSFTMDSSLPVVSSPSLIGDSEE